MKVCLIYSGWLRTWDQCRPNHEEMLRPHPTCIVHYNENHGDMRPYKREDFEHYRANKAPETEPENTMNMWANMMEAWRRAPIGYDCYVRNRYDIVFSGPIDFSKYEMAADKVYIPVGQDYREGVNDQFAFGSFYAMCQYFAVFKYHEELFNAGKTFHSESYLKHTLDLRGIQIVRIPQTNTIIR